MNAKGDLCSPSVNPTVDAPDQGPGTQLQSPGLSKRRRPGRPVGSKNKAKVMVPPAGGLGLQNRTVFLPWNEIDISDSSEDDKNDFKDIHYNGSEWEDDTSNSEIKYEFKAVSEQWQAYRKGVQQMTRLLQNKGPITKSVTEAQRAFFPPLARRRTAVWNQAKEDNLNNRWEDSLEKAAIERYSKGANSLLVAWKITSDCFEYHGETKRNPLWTHDFCRKLTRIMAHPLFANGSDHRFIPIFIRWAVICRADDGHGFTETEQELLGDAYSGDLRPSDRPESMVERFRRYQQGRKDGDRIVSRHAQLMSRIADISKTIKKESIGSFAPVKTRDLTVIIEALDTLERYTADTTCETYFLVYSASKGSGVYPVGLFELFEAYKTSWINLERRRMPDYTQILLADITTNDQANEAVVAIEGAGEHDTDQTQCNPIRADDHGSKIASEANNLPRNSDGYFPQDHRPSRSPSNLEDGEIPEDAEAPASTHTNDDHLYESRRSLIRIVHSSGALAQSDPLKPPEITLTQSCESDFDLYQEVDKLLLSCSAPSIEHTEPKAPQALMTLPCNNDPYRDPAGFYDNYYKNDTKGDFRNVDKVFNRPNGNGKPSAEVSTTTQTSGALGRHKEPMTLPSRMHRRDFNGIQGEDYPKRRRIYGPNRSQVRRSDGRNSANERRGIHRPQRSPGAQLQAPTAPRAWQLEQSAYSPTPDSNVHPAHYSFATHSGTQDQFELSRQLEDSRRTISRMQHDLDLIHDTQRETASLNGKLQDYNNQLRGQVADLRAQLSYATQTLTAQIREQVKIARSAASSVERLQEVVDKQKKAIHKLVQEKKASDKNIQTLERSQNQDHPSLPLRPVNAKAETRKTTSQKRRERREAKREKRELERLSTLAPAPGFIQAPVTAPAPPSFPSVLFDLHDGIQVK
ncbi:unnamed protein product [Fusarium langsethiae]|nr:unnamed protein product [Fusarium langsethiae]